MVNVQDSREFSCQVLNRDVWSNQAVKTIVSEHFIFWQVMQSVCVVDCFYIRRSAGVQGQR